MTAHADLTKGVPPALAGLIEGYAQRRQPPTLFLRALLANDLEHAMGYAPPGMTMDELRATVRLIFNTVPRRARDGAAQVDAWLNGSTPAADDEAERKRVTAIGKEANT